MDGFATTCAKVSGHAYVTHTLPEMKSCMACVSDCQNETMLALALIIVSRDWSICFCVSELMFWCPLMSAPTLMIATPSSYIVTLLRSFLSKRMASHDCAEGSYLSPRYMGVE